MNDDSLKPTPPIRLLKNQDAQSAKDAKDSKEPSSESSSAGPNIRAIQQAVAVLSRYAPDGDPSAWEKQLGPIGSAIHDRRDSLIDHCGGDEHASVPEKIVCDQIAKSQVILEIIDQSLFDPANPKILDAKKGTPNGALLQRQKLADSLVRYAKELGFTARRPQKNVTNLMQELLAERRDEDAIEAARIEDIDEESSTSGHDPAKKEETDANEPRTS